MNFVSELFSDLNTIFSRECCVNPMKCNSMAFKASIINEIGKSKVAYWVDTRGISIINTDATP